MFSSAPLVSVAGGFFTFLEPNCTAREARRVEIAVGANPLAGQHGRKTCGIGLCQLDPGFDLWRGAARKGFFHHAACSEPWNGTFSLRRCAIVLPMSALLTGASLTKTDLKLGPIAAMKLMVSARLKLPCMPWPCYRPVSAISAVHNTG